MKIVIASVFALSLLGATSANAIGLGIHVGGVGIGAHIGGHHHGCRDWGWHHHRHYCRRWW